jgi:serine/threonine protein phosphatase PrpC
LGLKENFMKKFVLMMLCGTLMVVELPAVEMIQGCCVALATGVPFVAWKLYQKCRSYSPVSKNITKKTVGYQQDDVDTKTKYAFDLFDHYDALSLWGSAEAQGERLSMEDAHTVITTPAYHFYGLYDGHGGRAAADFAVEHLHKKFEYFFTAKNKNGHSEQCIDAVLHDSFLSTHQSFCKQYPEKRDGSCALVAVLHNNILWVANAGDSRAVRCCAGKARPLSRDHKPSRLDEQGRIEKAGGRIIIEDDVYRVMSHSRKRGLAVSRSLGDKSYRGLVIPDPEIRSTTLTKKDEFLILACDGVWDVVTNDGAVKIVQNYLEQHPGNMKGAAEHLKDEALKRDSTDNITVIVLDLVSYMRDFASK